MVVNYVVLQKYQGASEVFPNTKESHCITFLEPEEVWILEHIWLRGFRVGDCGRAYARREGHHTQNDTR